MRILLVFLVAVSLLGCSTKAKHKSPVKPLTGLQEFEIVPFFSPYTDFNAEQLLQVLTSSLQEIGDVKMKESLCSSSKASTYVLISMQDKESGTIQAFENVKVEKNKFETACVIWSADSWDEKSFSRPENENGEIVFKKQDFREKVVDSSEVMRTLITKFAKEYEEDNSNARKKPVFYLHKPLFRNGHGPLKEE